jgi:hypothetical protein
MSLETSSSSSSTKSQSHAWQHQIADVVLAMIMSYVTLRDRYITMERVCHRWYKSSSTFIINDHHQLLDITWMSLDRYLQSSSYIHHSIEFKYEPPIRTMDTAAPSFYVIVQRLGQRMKWSRVNQLVGIALDVDQLPLLVKQCPSLSTLSWTIVPPSSSSIITAINKPQSLSSFLSWTNLASLTFDVPYHVTDLLVLPPLPNLKYLSVTTKPDNYQRLEVGHMPELLSLRLAYFRFAMNSTWNSPKLSSLVILRPVCLSTLFISLWHQHSAYDDDNDMICCLVK